MLDLSRRVAGLVMVLAIALSAQCMALCSIQTIANTGHSPAGKCEGHCNHHPQSHQQDCTHQHPAADSPVVTALPSPSPEWTALLAEKPAVREATRNGLAAFTLGTGPPFADRHTLAATLRV